MKFIFVTGGVVSGLGKGVTAASLGLLLKCRGLKVGVMKLDPYMNVDTNTMSPFQHGEVFVTEDGAETDLDLGHYERFIDVHLNKYSNITSGRIYFNVLQKERNGDFGGKTVQIIPHVTNEIKEFIFAGAKSYEPDVMIIEIGGTAGDIEGQPFLEAVRQIQLDIGRHQCLFIHVTLVPYLGFAGEHKSKPTQHSVKELRSLGLSPDIIIARSDMPLHKDIKEKIALFCNVRKDCVIENLTLESLYEAPIMLKDNGLDAVVCRLLDLRTNRADISFWEKMLSSVRSSEDTVTLALVGKHVRFHDAYLSTLEALKHAGYSQKHIVDIKWIDYTEITEKNVVKIFAGCSGIIVPDEAGSETCAANVAVCKYAREHNIPYLGLGYGMNCQIIEYLTNVCNIIKESVSHDCAPKGKNQVRLKPGSQLMKIYGCDWIAERYRGSFNYKAEEFAALEDVGLVFSGMSLDGNDIQAIELPQNDFYVGVQYRPEFKSRPTQPHPLFVGFIKAAIEKASKNVSEGDSQGV